MTRVSLVIPALNEEGCIAKTIREVPRDVVDEIIVIDGHSSDNTAAEAQSALLPNDRVIFQKRKGFGGALYDAVDAATGEIMIIMDADGSHNPLDIPELLALCGPNTLVMASRYAKGGKSDDDTLIRWLGNQLFTKLTNLIHGTHVTDSLYLFCALPLADFRKLGLKSYGFEICIEFLVKAKRVGLNFKEVPATERPRLAGASKVNAFWHGLKMLKMVLRRY